jgi:hypothetical protein
VVSVVVVVLEELGIDELLDDDGVLLDDEDGELALELLSEPLALPLMELDELGGMELLLLDEPGVVLVVVSVVELELGEDGVALVEDGVVVVVVLLVPDLLRSQPVTAAVATASTATKGMSLFMTSPFEFGWWGVGRFPLGACDCSGSTRGYTHNTCQRIRLWRPGTEAANPFRRRGKLSGMAGNAFPGASDGHRHPSRQLDIIQIMRPAAGPPARGGFRCPPDRPASRGDGRTLPPAPGAGRPPGPSP